MRITSVDKIQPGDILGKSLFNERAELLLAAGYELKPDLIESIKSHGFPYVMIMDPAAKDLEPEEVIGESVRTIVNQKLANVFRNAKKNLAFEKFAPEEIKRQLKEDPTYKHVLDMPAVRRMVFQVIDEIMESQATMLTAIPMKSDSGHDYQHALDTTILAILIAQQFHFNTRELKLLGTACLTHDIGKLPFSEIAAKEDWERTAEEKMILREHPVYSKLIIEGSDPEAFVEQEVVLQHHEQINRRGYPQRLRSQNRPPSAGQKHDPRYIHRYAEILAVANVYDNLTSGGFDGTYYSPEEAIIRIVNGETGAWNEHVVRELVRVVQCFPVGSTIRINNNSSYKHVGFRGIVLKANPDDQHKPVVILTHNPLGNEIQPKIADLAEERTCKIEMML